jgi:hypothetical protein
MVEHLLSKYKALTSNKSTIKKEIKRKVMQTGKEEVKLSLFSDDVVLYLRD